MKAVGTNGAGEPRYPIAEVRPGCIARFGVDDDMTVLVVANFPVTNGPQNGDQPRRRLVYYGCFCDEPGSYEQGRLMHHDHCLTDTLTVVMMTEYS